MKLSKYGQYFYRGHQTEFGLQKRGVLIVKRGKVVKSQGISMANEKMMTNI